MGKGTSGQSRSEIRRAWSSHEERSEREGVPADLQIGIAATFTANNLVPYLGAAMLDAGFSPQIKLAPFNQLFQAALNPRAAFGTDCTNLIFLWRIEDVLLSELDGYLSGDSRQLDSAVSKVDELLGAISNLRKDFTGSIILSYPPHCSHGVRSYASLERPGSASQFQAAIVSRMRDRAVPGVQIMDLDTIQADFGIAASLDWRQWYLYRQPFSEPFLQAVAAKLARVIKATKRPPRKCIVLDADNTLWGGIVGEDGIDGIQLGDEFPGSAFRDFQRQLLHLRGEGVLLAIASKNNEPDVWEVFDKHEGMILKREHISAWEINWQPKAENIGRIAKRLNIGTDSLVFIDDNAMEIDYMTRAMPEVKSIHLPDEPADMFAMVQELDLFDTLEITEEDRRRADMMSAEAARNRLGDGLLSKEDFQNALQIAVEINPAASEDLGRVTQLINKTNQFNLTTRRRTLDEVRSLHAGDEFTIYTVRVSDKFGDYGLTGVLILARKSAKSWAIDTLLLSCRVLGRGVETALAKFISSEARKSGVSEIIGSFVATAKNAPAATFLVDHGFKEQSGMAEWRLLVEESAAEAV